MPTLRSAVITQLMASMGHEQVVFVAEREVGLRALIAIHSTALGPALGGVRFWQYASEHDAMVDALRLSEAMTLKAAMAGLHQGGGKTVVLWDDPDRAVTRGAAARAGSGHRRARWPLPRGRGRRRDDQGHERSRRRDTVGHRRRRVARRLRRSVTGHRVRSRPRHARGRDHARRRAVPARPSGRHPGVGARRVASRAPARGRRRRGRRVGPLRVTRGRARARAGCRARRDRRHPRHPMRLSRSVRAR